MTQFIKMAKHKMTEIPYKEYIAWIRHHKIIPAIFNEKSHSELINRSSDFLRYFLEINVTMEDLQPLLSWNEAILKLVSESFEEFPEEFQEEVVTRIKARKNVTNEDALNIIKKTINCESWLLSNGG
jgi:hypothetical protein